MSGLCQRGEIQEQGRIEFRCAILMIPTIAQDHRVAKDVLISALCRSLRLI